MFFRQKSKLHMSESKTAPMQCRDAAKNRQEFKLSKAPYHGGTALLPPPYSILQKDWGLIGLTPYDAPALVNTQ